MGTTPSGLPYPEPGDPISQGAANIKALAQCIQAGATTMSWSNANAATKTIPFAQPFKAAPKVCANDNGNSAETPRWVCRAYQVNANSFTLYLAAPNTTTTTATNHAVSYIAIGPV